MHLEMPCSMQGGRQLPVLCQAGLYIVPEQCQGLHACFWLCPEVCLPVQAARPDVSARLRGVPGVTVIPRNDDLKYRHAHSRIWNETWLAAFFHKPCNHELFVLQSLNMEGAILSS